MSASLQFLSPDSLHRNPAFSQLVVAPPNAKTVYIGGQNAVTADGRIVGQGDVAAQAEQVARNLDAALAAAGASREHIVKWNIHVVQGQSLRAAMEGFARILGMPKNAPAITVLYVAGLANPGFLIEVDAIAVVPASP